MGIRQYKIHKLTFQQWAQLIQSLIIRIAIPGLYKYPIIGLVLKVLMNIINDYYPWEISSYPRKILNKVGPIWFCVLSIESVFYVSLFIN